MFLLSQKPTLNKRDEYVLPLIPSLLVFAALLAIVLFSWNTAKVEITRQRARAVNENSAYTKDAITKRFETYEDTLRSASALFGASDSVTRSEWSTFAKSLDTADRYPGVRGIGYLELISNSEKEAYESSIKSEGFDQFKVYPEGARDSYAPVTFFELYEGDAVAQSRLATALGFDMYSQPDRKEAIERSMRSGGAVLSDPVTFVQSNESIPNGFLLYMPLYKKGMPVNNEAERVAAIDGYFYAAFYLNDLFPKLLSNLNQDFGIALYDINNGQRDELYDSTKNQDGFITQREENFTVEGQEWLAVYKIKSTILPDSINERPLSVLIGGTIFALALAVTIYLLIQRRTRNVAYMEERRLESAKDELLSLASHQLRTPATAVKQYVSLVKDGYAGEIKKEQKDLLEMAYESNERQLTIVNDLLYVARIDAGDTSLRVERLNLSVMLRSVIDDQEAQLKSKNQKVTLRGANKNIWLTADPRYVRMILENLLSNASKYSKEKKNIKIEVKSKGSQVITTITDKGVGIPAEEYDKVFQRFTRIPNELTRLTAGSGIGLYLAKQLALMHKGDITFTSVPGKGSSFTVTLPRKPIKEEKE